MKKVLVLTLCLSLSSFAIQAMDSLATVQKNQGNETLVLDKSLAIYLHNNFPGYTVPTISDKQKDWKAFTTLGELPPIYVTGDFNGDKIPDIALLLKKHDGTGLLVSIQQTKPGEFQHIVLATKIENLFSMGISREKQGETLKVMTGTNSSQRQPLTLNNDAISFFTYESASSVFYWDGQKYKQAWTSD